MTVVVGREVVNYDCSECAVVDDGAVDIDDVVVAYNADVVNDDSPHPDSHDDDSRRPKLLTLVMNRDKNEDPGSDNPVIKWK